MLTLSAFSAGALAADVPVQQELPPPSSDPVKPVPRDRDYSWMSLAQWNQKHADNVAVAEKGVAKLVFLGDSITDMTRSSASWKKTFAKYDYANFGIGGDRTQNLLWRLEHGERGHLKPKLVVVLIGTNNIGTTTDDVDDTVRGVTEVVSKVKKTFPGSKILLLGLFPRDEKPDAPVRTTVRLINEQLAKLADGRKVCFRDIGKIFLDADGTLPVEISADHLHPTEEGFRRWAEAIEPEVERLMR